MLYDQLADIRVACSYTEYKYLQPFPPAPFCFLPPQPEQFARPSVRPSSSNALPPSPFSACIGTTSRSTGLIALSALLTPLCDAIDTEQGATEAAESLGLLIVFTTRPDLITIIPAAPNTKATMPALRTRSDSLSASLPFEQLTLSKRTSLSPPSETQ